ncbi:hypothetical protein DRW03_34895 [Corallococcus sp. H22C18031201]|nr:hypothetical protein DRW03_34895 [Corallococcus sp. H22C18031201]
MQSYRWLPSVLQGWTQAHPNAEVTVIPEAGHAPLVALQQGTIDLAVVVETHSTQARLRFTPLFRDELVALVSAKHPLARRRRITVRALTEEMYWGSRDSFAPQTPLGRALAREGLNLPRVTPLPFASGAPVEMVRANQGVTVCPRWFAESELARGELVDLSIERGLWLHWSAATVEAGGSPLAASFIEEMKHHCPPTAGKRRA